MSTLDDLDELEVYGSDSQQQTGAKITQYTFEVRRHGELFILFHTGMLIFEVVVIIFTAP